jgi:tetratricopeptide (TPR) repeat protein
MQNKHAQVIEYGEKAIEDSQGRDAFTMLLVADSLAESALPIHADYKEKLTRAEQHATRALEILPEMFASMQRRPEVPEEEYARQQRRAEGLGHAILGNIFFRQQQHARAVEELTKAIETDGYNPDGVDFQRLGFSHLRQQQLKEAEAAFQKCVDRGGSAVPDCQKRLDDVRQKIAAQEKPQQ